MSHNNPTKTPNQIFDWQRFRMYVFAHWQEKKRSYLWFLAGISMMYCIILFMIDKFKTKEQMVLYYFGLTITGSIFALRYCSSLARPESALVTLMQPVSVFEKWLLAVLIILIGYPLVYTLMFEVMTLPVTWISKQNVVADADAGVIFDQGTLLNYQLFVPFTHITLNSRSITAIEQLPMISFFCGLCGYAVTSSIWFKRLPIMKSIFLVFFLALFLTIVAFNSNINNSLTFYFTQQQYQANNSAYIASILLWIIAPLCMWIASFFALKERDLV